MQSNSSKSKYLGLMEFLKEEMLMGRIQPGQQIPSENTLAEKFSMSRHTIRKAISMLVNEGYLLSEHGRGTFCVDRSHARRGSKNIGVITTYLSDYIFPWVIQGIDSVLSQNGYSIVLKNTNNDTGREALCLQDVLERNIEGLIVEPTKSALFSGNLKYYEALDKLRIPYIFIHGCYPNAENKSFIVLDDEKGMHAVVSYLIKLGHKRITGIFKADDIQGQHRHKGYARALGEAGLIYDPDDVVWFHTEDKAIKPSFEAGRIMASNKGVDAIVCYNDEIAHAVIEHLGGMGLKVPDDLSVTGFDDSNLSSGGRIGITSAAHPKEKLGEAAARMLLELLGDGDYLNHPVRRVIEPELVIRESCRQR